MSPSFLLPRPCRLTETKRAIGTDMHRQLLIVLIFLETRRETLFTSRRFFTKNWKKENSRTLSAGEKRR